MFEKMKKRINEATEGLGDKMSGLTGAISSATTAATNFAGDLKDDLMDATQNVQQMATQAGEKLKEKTTELRSDLNKVTSSMQEKATELQGRASAAVQALKGEAVPPTPKEPCEGCASSPEGCKGTGDCHKDDATHAH